MDERPYEPLHMETEDWLRITPEWVEIAKLHPSQEGVSFEGLAHALDGGESYTGDPHPNVVLYEGELHCVDGHHRVAVALCQGKHRILARVLRTPIKDQLSL